MAASAYSRPPCSPYTSHVSQPTSTDLAGGHASCSNLTRQPIVRPSVPLFLHALVLGHSWEVHQPGAGDQAWRRTCSCSHMQFLPKK